MYHLAVLEEQHTASVFLHPGPSTPSASFTLPLSDPNSSRAKRAQVSLTAYQKAGKAVERHNQTRGWEEEKIPLWTCSGRLHRRRQRAGWGD